MITNQTSIIYVRNTVLYILRGIYVCDVATLKYAILLRVLFIRVSLREYMRLYLFSFVFVMGVYDNQIL